MAFIKILIILIPVATGVVYIFKDFKAESRWKLQPIGWLLVGAVIAAGAGSYFIQIDSDDESERQRLKAESRSEKLSWRFRFN